MIDETANEVALEQAEIVREYAPFPEPTRIGGVTYDGKLVWCATGEQLTAVAPDSGQTVRTLEVESDAGTAFDGKYVYQLGGGQIRKLDPESGEVLSTIPAPGTGHSGLAWAEGSLWLGHYESRTIHKLDPRTGAVLRTLQSDRFVTGVSFVQGELWHATIEAGESELRRIDPDTGRVLTRAIMPDGALVSGLESDGGALLYCGGAGSGKLRAVRKPGRAR